MNILVWVLQISLALWNIIGGFYMANNYRDLANVGVLNSMPGPAWIALGVVQILFALGLVLPAVLKMSPRLVPISAACLVVISLLGIVLFAAYAGFPGILWGVVPAILAGIVAYYRWPSRSLAK